MTNMKNLNKNLDYFSQLDDYDILISIKEWQKNDDFILSTLSKQIIERKLHKIKEIESNEVSITLKRIKEKLSKTNLINKNDINYLAFPIRTKHKIYTPNKNPIYILKEKKHNNVLKRIEKELKFNKNQNTIIKNFICYHPSLKKL